MKYKIWAYIEEIDEEKDHYKDIVGPTEVVCFDNLEEAENTLSWFQEGA